MGYGAPLKNQNKGYAAQEKKDLGKMPGAFKQMNTGSWMSKHVSPFSMGTPLEGNKFGKAMADNDGDYEKAKASMAPRMESPATFTSPGDKKKKEKKVAEAPKKKQKDSKLSKRQHFEKGVNKSFISDVKNKGFVAAVKDNFKL